MGRIFELNTQTCTGTREKYGRGDYNKKDLKADEIEDLKYECLPGHFTEEVSEPVFQEKARMSSNH